MAQKIFGIGIAGTGIVGVLIATGFISNILNIETELGTLALTAGLGIGILLGLLGVFGVAKRVIG
jgi:hypothetical protein